ncbi:hypothetical protein WJX72_002174 [[Myrmecia] bisecta]|uniref:Uncharacterized protein n=1 Tax=[Myrmecia] bisecta TaxID=41462 RepID=A0AAW1R494_9CHLO
MADELVTGLIGLCTLLGAWTILHTLGFTTIYKLIMASATGIGCVVIYRLLKGESLDSAAGDVRRTIHSKAAQAKGQAKGAYKDAKAQM